jgi:hypothetical protein
VCITTVGLIQSRIVVTCGLSVMSPASYSAPLWRLIEGIRLTTWTDEHAGSENKSLAIFEPRKPQPPTTRTVPRECTSATDAMLECCRYNLFCIASWVSCLLVGEVMEVGDIHTSVRLRACHNILSQDTVGSGFGFCVGNPEISKSKLGLQNQ